MHYIGIDVSKLKLDFALLNERGKVVDQAQVKNTTAGITALLKHWNRAAGLDRNACLACLEPTGHYSHKAIATLLGLKVPTWVAHPLDIKRSMGMVRGKDDKIDAVRIALYAMRNGDKERLIGPGTVAVLELKQLIAHRHRMVVDKRRHSVYKSDVHPCVAKGLRQVFNDYSTLCIQRIEQEIKKVDRMIEDHIARDPDMLKNYNLLLSVERVGPVLAAQLLAATENFNRMKEARQLACHAGVAPHRHTSGSSIRGSSRVSHQADKRLKTVLHMAAMGASRSDTELGVYYRRKLAQGKNPMSALNALRNKIVHRVCAVIKRGSPYELRPIAKAEPTTCPDSIAVVAQIAPIPTFARRAKRKRALLESNPSGINPMNAGHSPRAKGGRRPLLMPGVPHASEKLHT